VHLIIWLASVVLSFTAATSLAIQGNAERQFLSGRASFQQEAGLVPESRSLTGSVFRGGLCAGGHHGSRPAASGYGGCVHDMMCFACRAMLCRHYQFEDRDMYFVRTDPKDR
jgi:hypothetical protein